MPDPPLQTVVEGFLPVLAVFRDQIEEMEKLFAADMKGLSKPDGGWDTEALRRENEKPRG